MKHFDSDFFKQLDQGNLPLTLGIRFVEVGEGFSILEMELQQKHMNYRNFVHGGSVVTLADTTAGYGTLANLPEEAEAFTTLELKCNFVRAAATGTTLQCRADCIHLGRTTQVWDSRVINLATSKTVAEFRCTQMIMYPK